MMQYIFSHNDGDQSETDALKVSGMNHEGVLFFYGLLLGLGVFVLCLLGIISRPHLDLAAFWPANAFMLGMMIRFPCLARGAAWVSCAAGFFLADALTGSDLLKNLVLNGGNLAGIATGYALLAGLPLPDQRLQKTRSILYFLRAIMMASLVAGLTGIIANPLLFGGGWKQGFIFWSATEMTNYMAVLPVLLTLPRLDFRWQPIRQKLGQISLNKAVPLLALMASAMGSVLIGGPGAVAFPVPALLWCALSYNLFTISCLAFAFSTWTLLTIHIGLMPVGDVLDPRELLISTRVGVTLIALAPLVVGSVMAARDELVERLSFLASRDALTGLRNRRAFFEDGSSAIEMIDGDRGDVAVMMLDIDHFKSINDTFGHEAGDKVLSDFAGILQKTVREGDIVGRIGGEEFAVVLPECDVTEAVAVAHRIGDVLRSTDIMPISGASIRATVSIGLILNKNVKNLDRLLAHADEALYRAKTSGRDRCELSYA
ncbi:MAG: sensor domain-containing diguanylate cyclase [Sphingobium sp.]|nr:sensor domain-containing diguanylate cyclase [Sphingobium sp.]